ncbi:MULTISPECIES: hypothetical protein [unclassified Microcystis]|uniref:hypothetical protein n=1 Tax=unclassified Microcystis TaxID=2643300 RepID=UPI00258E047A|nr:MULTISPECIES: hypothetical protein [unclassified Microcystis]MCA2508246.1 hypothetical protein [Microcystis sp. M62BS1]MCA2520024.1 hypothetical protein [Microcystis sp. M63BS1]MCA2551182.1 hypothetical protein [Microcystis sp. M53BS1]MCA2515066.1 hypothetical protein [Microcystis sp. M59BS1]MCA2532819.1 hypothetical protein [Microcystis sp. M51BS1]
MGVWGVGKWGSGVWGSGEVGKWGSGEVGKWGSGVWGVGCGVWGVGRINKTNLLSPVSESRSLGVSESPDN